MWNEKTHEKPQSPRLVLFSRLLQMATSRAVVRPPACVLFLFLFLPPLHFHRKVCAGQRGLRTISPPTLPSKFLPCSGDNFLLSAATTASTTRSQDSAVKKSPTHTDMNASKTTLGGENFLKVSTVFSVMLLKLPLPQAPFGAFCVKSLNNHV